MPALDRSEMAYLENVVRRVELDDPADGWVVRAWCYEPATKLPATRRDCEHISRICWRLIGQQSTYLPPEEVKHACEAHRFVGGRGGEREHQDKRVQEHCCCHTNHHLSSVDASFSIERHHPSMQNHYSSIATTHRRKRGTWSARYRQPTSQCRSSSSRSPSQGQA